MLYETLHPERLNTYLNYALLVVSSTAPISIGAEYLMQKIDERRIMRNIKSIEPALKRNLEEQGVSKDGIDKILNRK